MALTLEWIGHACFRAWARDGPVVVTDPYEADHVGLPPTTIAGDVVIRSSADDRAHCCAEAVRGRAATIDATAVAAGRSPEDLPVVAVAAREHSRHPSGAPGDNAMYAFSVGDMWVLHMGDAGALPHDEELAPFAGRCDVLLALAGAGLVVPVELPDGVGADAQPTMVVLDPVGAGAAARGVDVAFEPTAERVPA